MKFGNFPTLEAEGLILGHKLLVADQRFAKGRCLSAADIALLQAQGIQSVRGARLEAGDLPEDEAAEQLAGFLADGSLNASPAATGRVNVFAAISGLLTVDRAVIEALNQLGGDLTIATMPALTWVHAGQQIATIKVIPYAVPGAQMKLAEALCESKSALKVKPPRRRRVGLIQTSLPHLAEKVLDKTQAVTAARLAKLGAEMVAERRCEHDEAAAAEAIQALHKTSDLILLFGASMVADRHDILPSAVERLGGEIIHFGMPVDPGNLLFLGEWQGKPILGAPGCARSPKLNGFDWVLERLIADHPVDKKDIQGLGVGGLLSEIASRPAPRLKQKQKPSSAAKLAAAVLAAGRASRMPGEHKLARSLGGIPVIQRTLALIEEAGLAPPLVVTGNRREVIEALLPPETRILFNANYEDGMASSVRLAAENLRSEADALLIMLGDMPLVKAKTLQSLAQRVDASEPQILVPVFEGKRGNPMVWSRHFFAALSELEGDRGARQIIGRFEDAVVEVPVDDPGVLLDLDGPEAFAQAESLLGAVS